MTERGNDRKTLGKGGTIRDSTNRAASKLTSCKSKHISMAENFQFIAVSGENVRGDRATRKLVRSQAQAYFRRRNPPVQRRYAVDLDTTPLVDVEPNVIPSSSLIALRDYKSHSHNQDRIEMAGPLTLLDASRVDPFNTFDIGGSHRACQLWDHIYDGSCVKFRTMREIGFLDIVRETIALPQVLSAASWHLVQHLGCDHDSGEDAKYSLFATHSLQQKLNNPASGTTDEVIGAVLVFAVFANLIRDSRLLNVHMDGLSLILSLRGGDQTLSSSPVLRVVMYWVDVNGCLLQDSIPRHPQPFTLLTARNKSCFLSSDFDLFLSEQNPESFEDSSVVKYICESLRYVGEIIAAELLVRDLWGDPLFSGYYLSPICHDLLSVPRGTVNDNIYIRQKECFRLAAILYTMNLRGKFDYEFEAGVIYGVKLKTMLNTVCMMPEWGPSNLYLIWVLTVAASSSCLSEDLRNDFASLLSATVQSARMTCFEDLEATIEMFLWCDIAIGASLRALRSCVIFNISDKATFN